jgi:hypothetical protein
MYCSFNDFVSRLEQAENLVLNDSMSMMFGLHLVPESQYYCNRSLR